MGCHPTVADRDLFYRQWGDQLNGERRKRNRRLATRNHHQLLFIVFTCTSIVKWF